MNHSHPPPVARILTVASTWVPATVLAAAALVLGGRLPDRVAQHWSFGSATADGVGDTWSLFALCLTIAVAAAVASTWAGLRMTSDAALGRVLAPASILAGCLATAWITSVWATLDAGTPERAVLGWRILLVGVAVLWGAVPMVVLRGEGPLPASDTAAWQSDSEAAPFERSVTSRVMVGIAGGLLLLAVAMAAVGFAADGFDPAISVVSLVLLVTAGLLVELGRVVVIIDERGLRVVSARFRIPLLRAPLADVVSAAAVQLEPMQWGGWGWRWSPSATAYVTRRGPGIAVETRSGRRLAVSLDDAQAAAAVLRAYLGAPVP